LGEERPTQHLDVSKQDDKIGEDLAIFKERVLSLFLLKLPFNSSKINKIKAKEKY